MKVGIFLKTTSGAAKEAVLKDFAKGVKKSGDSPIMWDQRTYKLCDVAIIFGFFGQNRGAIQNFRKKIFQKHKKRSRECIFIESDLLKMAGEVKAYNDTCKSMHYRVPYKSVYFGESEFFNKKSPPDRWNLLCERKKIDVLPYRDDGEHILICMNRGIDGRGWSTKGTDTWRWLEKNIYEIRQHTNRKIRIRFHPMGINYITKNKKNIWAKNLAKNIEISGLNGEDIIDDCNGAWAAIAYNTSACVIPIVKGIPLFTTETDCIGYPIANTNIGNIESPLLIDRSQWFYDLAYTMWNRDEMKDGTYWMRYKSKFKRLK